MPIPKLNPVKQNKGMLQIVHDFECVAPNLGYIYSEIRDMTPEQKYDYMCSRVKKLADRGYGGVVLNTDFKNYLENDDDVERIVKVAEYAKNLGLTVWIYDEQYYPSGSAGGLTLKDHPELQTLGLAEVVKQRTTDGRVPIRVQSPYGHSELKYAVAIPIKDGEYDYDNIIEVSDKKDLSGSLCVYLPEGEWCLRCYFYRAIYDHAIYAQAYRASRRTVNIYDSKSAKRFFDVTFKDGYMKHVKGKLGDIVEAAFTDEPSYPDGKYHTTNLITKTKFFSHSVWEEEDLNVEFYPYIIWAKDLPEKYEKEYGENLIPLLPHLFTKTPRSSEIRTKFYLLTSKTATEGFYADYRNRLEHEGVQLTGHLYLEENVDCHPIFYGDIIDILSNFSQSGCDFLWSGAEMLRYSTACKVASSASHLKNKDETMIEASTFNDKDKITLGKLKGAMSMMFVHGITRITSYYGEDILSPEEMTAFANYVSKLSSLFEGGKYKVDTLLYYPYEQVCSEVEPFIKGKTFFRYPNTYHDSQDMSECSIALMQSQVGFDIINKTFLLKTKIGNGELLLENGSRVNRLVLPNIAWVDEELGKFLESAKAHGVKILSPEGKPIKGLSFAPEKMNTDLLSSKEMYLKDNDPYILAMQREFPDYDIFMLVNSAEWRKPITVNILDNNSSYALIDIDKYEITPIPATINDGYARIQLDCESLEAKFIIRYKA